MPETELSEKLREMGFAPNPCLPGNPDYANFELKIALTIISSDAYQELGDIERKKFNSDFKKRFVSLTAKHWRCGRIHDEDSLEKKLSDAHFFISFFEESRIHLPEGPEPTYKKLVALLKETDDIILSERRKDKMNYARIFGAEKRRKTIEQHLHVVLKPIILERDNYCCRACGSTDKLELARTSGGDMAKPEWLSKKKIVWVYPDAEKRWASENLLILCQRCHKYFDSFRSRLRRYNAKTTTAEEWVDLIRSHQLDKRPLIRASTFHLDFEKQKARSLLMFSRTLLKVLRKAIIFYKKGDAKKSRLFLGHVKKNWRILSKSKLIAEDAWGNLDSLLGQVYTLGSIARMEELERLIRNDLFALLEKISASKDFSTFKEGIAKQDSKLSKLM